MKVLWPPQQSKAARKVFQRGSVELTIYDYRMVNYFSPSKPLLWPSEQIDEVSWSSGMQQDSNLPSQYDKRDEGQIRSYAAGSKRRKPKKRWYKTWWFEILAALFSLSCIAANTGFLLYLDQRPYQSWRIAKVNVTPNAIISILATANKASLLLTVAQMLVQLKWLYFQGRGRRLFDLQVFDDASQGPLGSLRLLWDINLRVNCS